MKMKRMIFRISRGRAISAFYSLEINNDEYLLTSTVRQRGMSLYGDNQPGKLELLSSLIQSKDVGSINTEKKIFTVIFTGSEENILLQKLLKVCEVFQASRYPVPKNSEVRNEIDKIEQEIKDKKNLMVSLEKNLQDFIIVSNTYDKKRGYKYSLYRLFFEQEKMVYTTLNKCIMRDTFVDGQVWIPISEVEIVNNLLRNIFKDNEENKTTAYLEDIPTNKNVKPPTYIQSDEFISAFQQVVDTYGIPRYREINPGYFTIITFPFLFGVMFGDIGHGGILLLFAIYLCLFNDKIAKSKSLLKPLLFARYFLLLMGFFSVYCGFLYNDFLSIPFDMGTCYDTSKNGTKGVQVYKKDNCNYKFGLDPIWYVATNELAFINSLKMKISVIFGVFQMVIGIVLKGLNAVFQRDFVDFIFIFFPQITLMLILFGYMDFLIFVKWSTEYGIHPISYIDNEGKNQTAKFDYSYYAPDIKSLLMNIFLNMGEPPQNPPLPIINGTQIKKEDLAYSEWHLLTDSETFTKIHIGIIIASLICIIIMLLPKIVINYLKSKKNASANQNNIVENQNEENEAFNENLVDQRQEVEGEPSLSNFVVESSIETIEFVLGTVSNTASYLRLWALSLAHSQLAVVFFSKTIAYIGNMTSLWGVNGILLLFAFPIFAGVTTIVLLFMDMMECFLHTLRLHWVEFQNKFFKADGYQFKPFCFAQNLVLNDEEFSE
jgi:V-type H+-transporting ATPase subunit a